jgi:hypothetical protein
VNPPWCCCELLSSGDAFYLLRRDARWDCRVPWGGQSMVAVLLLYPAKISAEYGS